MTKKAAPSDERRRLVPIDSLELDPGNANEHSDASIASKRKSLVRFGQQLPLVTDADGLVRAGNGRLMALREIAEAHKAGEGWPVRLHDQVVNDNLYVWAIVSDLEGPDLVAYALADNRTSEFSRLNPEALERLLAEFDDETREAIGFGAEDAQAVADLMARGNQDGGDYGESMGEPVGPESSASHRSEPPSVDELYDIEKALQLAAAIDGVPDLPDDVRAFLEAAAERHVRFDYDKIAEFYYHATDDVQRLMKQSALV